MMIHSKLAHVVLVCLAALSACSNPEMTVRLAIDGPMEIKLQGPMMVFEGTYISDSLFERIDAGKTKTDWVRALLGDPTTITTLDDGTEVWKWVYREHGFDTSVVSVLDDEGTPTLPQVLTFVRVRDGVVIEKWRG